jgi:hypothetical protein
MTPEKLAVARRMLAEGTTKAVVAQAIGVSRPTLCAHLKQPVTEIAIRPDNARPARRGADRSRSG